MCDLAWTTGRIEASFEHAERAVEHARRAGIGFEVAAALNFVAALVQGRTPVSEAVSRCVALEREVVGHRAAELSLLGCRAALAAMAGRVRRGARRAWRSRAPGSRSSVSTRPRPGWPSWTRRPRCPRETRRPRPRAALDAQRITRAIGDRWFLSAALVDHAHALLAQGLRRRRGGGRRGNRQRPGAERHGVADQAPYGPRHASPLAGARSSTAWPRRDTPLSWRTRPT